MRCDSCGLHIRCRRHWAMVCDQPYDDLPCLATLPKATEVQDEQNERQHNQAADAAQD